MPFVFNNLNYKLDLAQIDEAEKEAKKLGALGKQLADNPEPVEKLESFINKYAWMPPDVLAGLGIASLTNPAINLDDAEPFVNDLINAWTKNSKENSNRLTSLLKGSIRAAFVGFDGLAERFIKRPIQAAGGVYAGENINPTAALLDIIPGLGFTLVKGLGMTDMSFSEFYRKRNQKTKQLGPTVAEESIKRLLKGEKVNLGEGFFGNSTLAEDTEVYKQISEQTQNPEILENARKLIQDQLGQDITVAERQRVNSNTFKFDDGSIRPISPGLLLAHNVATPEDKTYNLISGLVDGVFTFGLDPTNLLGGYFAKAGRLKKSLNPDVVKNRFITGRLARKMVNVPEGRVYLNSPAVKEIALIGSKSKNIRVQRNLTRDQIKDVVTLNRMVKAETPEEWIKAIEDYGIHNINKRFEKSSKFHVDYKDGEKLLKASPEHFKQRRVVELYKHMYKLFDDSNPTGNLKNYSIAIQKSLYNSPVARAMKDLPQTTLNTLDLNETALALDDWAQFLGAPDALRNAIQEELVGIIQRYNIRKSIAAEYKAGLITKVDLDNYKKQFEEFADVDLTREPSLLKIRTRIQGMLTGKGKIDGVKYTLVQGQESGAEIIDYTYKPGKGLVSEFTKEKLQTTEKQQTLFSWFDEWAISRNLPPVSLKLAREAIANTNEGQRLYLLDRLGKTEIHPSMITKKGTDVILRNTPQETLEALPTASKLTEYLTYAITLPDPRELNRYIGSIRNSVSFLAQASIFGGKGLTDADSIFAEFPIERLSVDKRDAGLLAEKAAEGFVAKVARATRDSLKYKITDEGIEQATLLKLANGYMSKAWKPLALLRFAWTLRVVGEEQMRMWASDLDNVFTSPLSYFSYWFGDNAPMKSLAGNMQNAIKYKAAMSKGHGGFIGVNNFQANRIMTTVGKADKRYGTYWMNSQMMYINDVIGSDLLSTAVDLRGKRLAVTDAARIYTLKSQPLNKNNYKALLGDDESLTIGKNIQEFLNDLNDGIVVTEVSKYANLDQTLQRILRRELEYFTQDYNQNLQEAFNPNKIIAKLMKTKANSKMFEGFTKNQVIQEMKKVLDNYTIANAPAVKSLNISAVDDEMFGFMLNKINSGETNIVYGAGKVGEVVGFNDNGKINYFVVERVDIIKNKVKQGEDFALTIDQAKDKLVTSGYSDSEANRILGESIRGKEKLTAAATEKLLSDIDNAIIYTELNSPIVRLNRVTGPKNQRVSFQIQEDIYNTKQGVIELTALKQTLDISSVPKNRLDELNLLAIDNSIDALLEILYYGFGQAQWGKGPTKAKKFFTARAMVIEGAKIQEIKPTKLGQKVIDLGLVDEADDLVIFASSRGGAGQVRQILDLLQQRKTEYLKNNVKLKTAGEIKADAREAFENGNKVLSGEIDSLLRQEALTTLRPVEKASFNFVTDLFENKVTRVISGGQTGADIAGLKIAKELDIQTSGFLPRDFWTEDGRNFSLQARYQLQPDKNPYDAVNLVNKGIVPKGKFNTAQWDEVEQAWFDYKTTESNGVFVTEWEKLTYKNDAAKIKSLEYRSRAIKNVDAAHVTIILTKPGVDSRGTKSTLTYATEKKWGLGKDKSGYIWSDKDLEFPEKANHLIFTNRVSDARTNYSAHKDVVVINIDKFVADGKIDEATIAKIDNLLSHYENPVVNIAGPSELKVTGEIVSDGKKIVGDKRKYLEDTLESNLVNQEKNIKAAEVVSKQSKRRHEELAKEYNKLEIALQNRLRALTDSKADYSSIKITLPFELKNIEVGSDEFVNAIKNLKDNWVIKDRTGKVIRKLERGEIKIAEEELKKANVIFKQKVEEWNKYQSARSVIDSGGQRLPFDEYKRLSLEDSELYRPWENKVSAALEQILTGTRKSRFTDSFDNLVAKYTGEGREYFDELASDAFDNAQEVKAMVAADDVLIQSQLKSYLADLHLLAGGDYEIILRNKNVPDFLYNINETDVILRNKKDPGFQRKLSGIDAKLDEPVTIKVKDSKGNLQDKTYKNVRELIENERDFYYDYSSTKSIPTNPMGDKQYSSLAEMYRDGYYFDYNITKTGDEELLRVMAGVDPFTVNYKGNPYSVKVGPNMTNAEQKAFIKWLETKKHIGPSRVKGAATVRERISDDPFAALDQATEQLFDTFMSGPTNMFSRSPAFMQFYMDKVRQLARYATSDVKKRLVKEFEIAWNVTNTDSIDVGLVRKINEKRKDLWFDKNFRQDFLKEMAIPTYDDVIDLKTIPKNRRYNMDFTMSPADNIYGEKATTMELLLANKRTSTTRKWQDGPPKKGEIIQFKDKQGNLALVKVTAVRDWKTITESPELLRNWSKKEGWTITYGLKKANFNKYDPESVFQVEFERYTDKIVSSYEEIDDIAKAYALEETKRLLYDLDKRGQITDALRLVFPFGEAYKEILTTQFRLLKNNPQKLRKASIAIQGARRDSIFGSDPNHNEGFFAKDPMTGEEMYNFADPGGLLSGLIVGDTADNTGVRLNLKGYTRNLNMLTTTILPGVGPVIQIPAAALSSATEFTKLSDFLFPYGRPEVRKGIAGVLDLPKAFVQASIPSYMRKFLSAISPNPSGRADLEGFDPGSDPAGALASTTKDILKVRAYAGTADFSSIESQNAEIKSAVRAARGLTFIRSAVQFLWFTGAEARYEAVISPEGAAFIDPSKTKDIDPEGTIVGMNQLVQAYYRLYEMAQTSIRQNPEMADQDPQYIATQNYMILFGANPVPLLIRKTREITEYPLGESGLKWARDNKELFATHPNTATFAKPYEPFDEFDIRAWRESISAGARVGLTPEQWVHLNNQANGRIAATYVQNELDNNPNFGMWTTYQKNTYFANIKTVLMDLYPGFGSELTAAGPTDLDTKLRELRTWNQNSTLSGSETGKALQLYLDYRDELMAFYKMETGNNLSSIEGTRAIGVRNSLRLFANQLIIQYPEFRYLYNSILSRELEENERSVPDGFRILGA